MSDLNEIKKLESLKAIRPDENWVGFAKRDIFEKIEEMEESPSFVASLVFNLKRKPVLAAFASFVFMMGFFGFSQKAMPGDALYSVKRIIEKGQASLVPGDGKLAFELKIVNQRLDELNNIVSNNNVGRLAPAVKEVSDSLTAVAGRLKGIEDSKKIAKVIIEETEKIRKTKGAIEDSLATRIGDDDTDNEIAKVLNGYYKIKITVEQMIADLNRRTLSEGQGSLFKEAIGLYEGGEYEKALEVMLNI